MTAGNLTYFCPGLYMLNVVLDSTGLWEAIRGECSLVRQDYTNKKGFDYIKPYVKRNGSVRYKEQGK